MAAASEKLPGVKGKHLHNPRDDRSVTFTLRGGPHDSLAVRLYPENNGFTRFVLDSQVYLAAANDQDPKKPYLMYQGEQ